MSNKKENIKKMYESLRGKTSDDLQEQLKSEIKKDPKVRTMISVAHKIAKNTTFSEFYDFAVDEKNIPAVKLTTKEMELVAGGSVLWLHHLLLWMDLEAIHHPEKFR